ncbi:MAG: 4Fe-4S binding protein [Kiritimatiellia bacterium]
MKDNQGKKLTRRDAVAWLLRGGTAAVIAGIVAKVSARPSGDRLVWQIDPRKCIQCGRCETACVLQHTAVRCVHGIEMCGYCKLCFGYFKPDAPRLDEAAENQICPTGALVRKFVEPPYFEYVVDKELCTGCGLCVKGCTNFGNGSLYLQVCHDICVNCNTCRISEVCPSGAFVQVPESEAYLLKEKLPRT